MNWGSQKISLFFILLLTGLALTNCASLSSIDREFVNHPAMDLRKEKTPSGNLVLTQLKSIRTSASSAGCSACAH